MVRKVVGLIINDKYGLRLPEGEEYLAMRPDYP